MLVQRYSDVILNLEDKLEYDGCLATITDYYNRMASNRDVDYRQKQTELVKKMLERMTGLLEQVGE